MGNNRQRTAEALEASPEKIKSFKLLPFVKGLHSSAAYLDPETDPDVWESFRYESTSEKDRQELLIALESLRDLLTESTSLADFKIKGAAKAKEAADLLDENVAKITEYTKDITQPLAELDLYYRNTGLDEIDNITLVAIDADRWKDDPDDEIYQQVYQQVNSKYDSVDKKHSVGYIVMPKFPGSALLDRLAGLAHDTKSTLLTSYRDLPDVKTTMKFLENDKVGGTDPKWGNVVVYGNTAVTKEGIRLSPVPAIAGKMHVGIISQPVAGLSNGSLAIEGLRYNVTQTELKLFKKNGIVPLLNAFNADMGYGTWTAFKGDNLEVQQYAVVRVLNWISRSLCHNLNKCTHDLATDKKLNKINTQVSDFLEQARKNGIIKKGTVAKFQQDPTMLDKIDIELAIQPLWAIRLFAMAIKADKDIDAKAKLSH